MPAAKKPPAARKDGGPALHTGDKVRWSTSQGETEGTITRKLTGTAHVDGPSAGHTAKASAAAPQYEVKSSKSGKKAIHKPGALHKVR